MGLGYWGPNLVRVIQELEGVELAYVCDRDAAALRRVCQRFPATQGVSEIGDVLQDESVDAVALATPVGTHFQLASAALRAGKHVFVEKPLAASLDEALRLAVLAEQSGLVLMPGHTFLYSPPVNAVHDLIQGGHLGDIYFISMSRVNLGLHQSDASVIWDLGPHDFSILRYWMGESPVRVGALSRACVVPTTPDVAFISAEYAGGAIAHVELSWLAPSKLRRTTVVGSERMVVYDDTSTEPVRIYDSGVDLPTPRDFGEYRLTYRTGDIVSPRLPSVEPLAAEMADFAEAIASGESPTSSIEIGIDVVGVMESVDASLASRGAPVEVAPPVGV